MLDHVMLLQGTVSFKGRLYAQVIKKQNDNSPKVESITWSEMGKETSRASCKGL